MIFIGGISSGRKQIEYLKTVICAHCGAYGRYEVFMTYMYFSFFFIPLLKWNKKYYVRMSCCGTLYELDPEVGRRLSRGEDLEIQESDLNLIREGSGNPWNQTKKCARCGYETEEDFAYCPKCGSPL